MFLWAERICRYLNFREDIKTRKAFQFWLYFVFTDFIGGLSSMLKVLVDKSTTLLAAFGTIYYVIKIVIRKCFPCQQRLRISLPLKCLSPCKGQRHVGEKISYIQLSGNCSLPADSRSGTVWVVPIIAYRMSVGTHLWKIETFQIYMLFIGGKRWESFSLHIIIVYKKKEWACVGSERQERDKMFLFRSFPAHLYVQPNLRDGILQKRND